MSKEQTSEEIVKPCPEFPYFGACYPDARCIDGNLHDMDKCDDNGNLYEALEYNPCPNCQREEFIRQRTDDEWTQEEIDNWLAAFDAKYNSQTPIK